MGGKIFERNGYSVHVSEPEVYVDNKARNRSGHMSHAMAEFKPGCFIEFNSNCSSTRCEGHSAFGWIEYRISRDCGKTYSDVYELDYSKEVLMEGRYTISVEKAVATDDGKIVAFCLRNSSMGCCEPWDTPMVIISEDEGKTWSEARECSPYKGRIYDAIYHNGEIYFVIFCNDDFIGTWPMHVYRVYKSSDSGKTFEEISVVPLSGVGHSYCTFFFDGNDDLHLYTYNYNNEFFMDHAISSDFGKTWKICEPVYVAKGIRNPQTNFIDGVYILHGRGAMTCPGFVLYTSTDGVNWDEGDFMNDKKTWYAHYSCNMVTKDEEGTFALIQYSDLYGDDKSSDINRFGVNANHIRVRIKK